MNKKLDVPEYISDFILAVYPLGKPTDHVLLFKTECKCVLEMINDPKISILHLQNIWPFTSLIARYFLAGNKLKFEDCDEKLFMKLLEERAAGLGPTQSIS